MTDIGVIVGFGQLSYWQMSSNWDPDSDDQCTIDATPLFIASIIFFFVYRVICSFHIYLQTKSCCRILSQMLDLELFRAVFLNYKSKCKEPNSPQKWIQSSEALFEAFPQTLIQLYYVFKTNDTSFIVILSLIASLNAIISKIVTEDKVLWHKYWQSLCCRCSANPRKIVNYRYVLRVWYRSGDIVWRISILLLTWLIVNGLIVVIVIGVEFIMLILMSTCVDHKFNISILQWVFITPLTDVSNKSNNKSLKSRCFVIFRWLEHLALLILVLFVGTIIDVESNEYDIFASNQAIGLMIYCAVAQILSPVVYVIIQHKNLVSKSVSVERSLMELAVGKNRDAIKQFVDFGFTFSKNQCTNVLYYDSANEIGFDILGDILKLVVKVHQYDVITDCMTEPEKNSQVNIWRQNRDSRFRRVYRILKYSCEHDYDEYDETIKTICDTHAIFNDNNENKTRINDTAQNFFEYCLYYHYTNDQTEREPIQIRTSNTHDQIQILRYEDDELPLASWMLHHLQDKYDYDVIGRVEKFVHLKKEKVYCLLKYIYMTDSSKFCEVMKHIRSIRDETKIDQFFEDIDFVQPGDRESFLKPLRDDTLIVYQ